MSEPPATAPTSFMSEAFVRVYEASADRITGPFSGRRFRQSADWAWYARTAHRGKNRRALRSAVAEAVDRLGRLDIAVES